MSDNERERPGSPSPEEVHAPIITFYRWSGIRRGFLPLVIEMARMQPKRDASWVVEDLMEKGEEFMPNSEALGRQTRGLLTLETYKLVAASGNEFLRGIGLEEFWPKTAPLSDEEYGKFLLWAVRDGKLEKCPGTMTPDYFGPVLDEWHRRETGVGGIYSTNDDIDRNKKGRPRIPVPVRFLSQAAAARKLRGIIGKLEEFETEAETLKKEGEVALNFGIVGMLCTPRAALRGFMPSLVLKNVFDRFWEGEENPERETEVREILAGQRGEFYPIKEVFESEILAEIRSLGLDATLCFKKAVEEKVPSFVGNLVRIYPFLRQDRPKVLRTLGRLARASLISF